MCIRGSLQTLTCKRDVLERLDELANEEVYLLPLPSDSQPYYHDCGLDGHIPALARTHEDGTTLMQCVECGEVFEI